MESDENLLVQFDNETWAMEKNLFKKFLEYKKRNGYYNGIDCDVSLAAITSYKLIYPYLNDKQISLQKTSKYKYEFNVDNFIYKGDTLTSALTVIKKYLGFLWKEIDNSKEMKDIEKYQAFYNLFDGVSSKDIPIAKKGKWNEYCYNNAEIIWNAMDDSAKLFLKNYMKLGNYICIPGNTYKCKNSDKYVSFNTARSNYGTWDTVDTLLWKIYQYFETKDIKYIEEIFTCNKKQLTSDFLKWNEDFNIHSWDDFIEVHKLQGFISDRRPVSLKDGNPIQLDIGKNYNAIPTNYDECLKFFETSKDAINYRTKNLYEYIINKVESNKKGEIL